MFYLVAGELFYLVAGELFYLVAGELFYLEAGELFYLVAGELLVMMVICSLLSTWVLDDNIMAQTRQCRRRCLAMMLKPHKLIQT